PAPCLDSSRRSTGETTEENDDEAEDPAAVPFPRDPQESRNPEPSRNRRRGTDARRPHLRQWHLRRPLPHHFLRVAGCAPGAVAGDPAPPPIIPAAMIRGRIGRPPEPP